MGQQERGEGVLAVPAGDELVVDAQAEGELVPGGGQLST
jgi:hypothetical protein